MKENEIIRTDQYVKIFDEDSDMIKVQSFGDGIKLTCDDEVRIYKNGAIELIEYFKEHFKV